MRGWPLAPAPWLTTPVDPDVTAWCDEIDAAIDTHDLPRLDRAQAALALPGRSRPPAPTTQGPAPLPPTVDTPPTAAAPTPPPAALAAPTTGPRLGAWARRATKETP